MGYVSKILLKPGCVPRKFDCQPDRRKRTNTLERPYIKKKRKMETIEECLKESIQSSQICSTQSTVLDNIPDTCTGTLNSRHHTVALLCFSFSNIIFLSFRVQRSKRFGGCSQNSRKIRSSVNDTQIPQQSYTSQRAFSQQSSITNKIINYMCFYIPL